MRDEEWVLKQFVKYFEKNNLEPHEKASIIYDIELLSSE